MRPIVLLLVFVAACTGGAPGADADTSIPTSALPATAAATVGATSQPSPTIAALGTPASGAPSEPRTDEPPSVPPEGADPPSGTLVVGTRRVDGYLGSYCYGRTCVDGPFPRKEQLPTLAVGSGEEIEFELGDDARFVAWSVSYGADAGAATTELGRGGEDYDADITPSSPWTEHSSFTVQAPPRGDWFVSVYLQLVHGDLSYGWHVTAR